MNTGAVPRGKHRKIAKMKAKYGDQDEEERQMKMALIGSKHTEGFSIQKHHEHKLGKLANKGVIQEKSEAAEVEEEEERAEVEVDKEVDMEAEEQTDQTKAEEPSLPSDSKPEDEVEEPEEASKEESKDEKEEKDDDALAEAEIAKLIKEEDINVLAEDTDVSEIDKLTGVPRSNGKYHIKH